MKAEACAVIILAAGGSTRLGRPKQLLRFKQQSLITRLVSEAKKTTQTVVVVTGACHDKITEELQGEAIHIVENKEWRQGMGSSISAGMGKLKRLNAAIHAVILAVCDQPFVTAALFKEMQSLHISSGKKIVACSYANSAGTPVFFEHTYFDALLQLDKNTGAKKLVQRHKADVALLPFPQGAFDIDTQADYDALLQQTGA